MLLLLAGCAEPEVPLRARLEQRIEVAADHGFSGVVRVVRQGEVLVERGSGLADREKQVPNQPSVAFDVGSITKELTAAAVFRLEEQGALSVDDPLSALLPDVPADKAAITLRQVLRHEAGFLTYHDTDGDFEPMTRLEARARILAQDLQFEPGTDRAYSNSGFTLLADVVETVGGVPYVDFVRDELFAPAGMGASGFYADPVWDRVPTAIGYDGATFGSNDPAEWPFTWALVGNGGLVSTVGDLDRWLVAVRSGQVLDEPARYDAIYLAPDVAWYHGHPVYSFAGAGDFGFGGIAVDGPETDTRVILVTNAYDAYDTEGLAEDLALEVL